MELIAYKMEYSDKIEEESTEDDLEDIINSVFD